MLGILLSALAPLIFLLIGGSGIETAILTGEDMFTKVAMSILFSPFVLVGLIFSFVTYSNIKDFAKGIDKDAKKALSYDETKTSLSPFRMFLVRFREHYADFFDSSYLKENEAIQQEATQIYRTLLGLRKERLKKLGITLEMRIKSMKYDRPDGIATKRYSDGKYDITEVEEEIVAKTSYKKDGKYIHTRTDKDLACYTIVHAKQVGEDRIICPNCGGEATREELLDGCDYCGTKFLIEDLEQRVAEFAFRPDYKAAKARYDMRRNQILLMLGGGIVLVMLLGTLIYSLIQAPQIMAEEGVGIIMTITAVLFASVIGSAFILILLVFLFPMVIPVIGGLLGGIELMSKSILQKLTVSRKNDLSYGERIRQFDPNFSVTNFYSGLQNKIASILYANDRRQVEAFTLVNISDFLKRYSNVINVETEYMGITDYHVDDKLQHMDVEVSLNLTEYDGKKVCMRKEAWRLKLQKAASCTTQIVCAPVITTCKSCGTSLDLLRGKTCSFCGNELDLKQYDWVIEEIQLEEM